VAHLALTLEASSGRAELPERVVGELLGQVDEGIDQPPVHANSTPYRRN
jgi:hypothetical protein